jgi:hypothetical protein
MWCDINCKIISWFVASPATTDTNDYEDAYDDHNRDSDNMPMF